MRDGKLGEERAGVIAQPFDRLRDVVSRAAILSDDRDERSLDVARELLHPVRADAETEVLGRDVLDLVCFVEAGIVTRRNDFAVRVLANRGVGAEQMVIDDDDVGRCGALPHPGDKAVVVPRTFHAEAGLGGRRHLVPEREIFRQVFELGAVAGLRSLRPLAHDGQEHAARGPIGILAQLTEPMKAQIICAAFHACSGERHAKRIAQRRDVLEIDLFLEILGAR